MSLILLYDVTVKNPNLQVVHILFGTRKVKQMKTSLSNNKLFVVIVCYSCAGNMQLHRVEEIHQTCRYEVGLTIGGRGWERTMAKFGH